MDWKTEWQGLIVDGIRANHYNELAQMRPELESIYNNLLAA